MKTVRRSVYREMVNQLVHAAVKFGYEAASHRLDPPEGVEQHSWTSCRNPQCSHDARLANEEFKRLLKIVINDRP